MPVFLTIFFLHLLPKSLWLPYLFGFIIYVMQFANTLYDITNMYYCLHLRAVNYITWIKFSTGEKTPIEKRLISKTFFLLEIPHIMFWQQWRPSRIFSSFGQIADLSQHVPPLWSIKENSCYSKMFKSPLLSLSVINVIILVSILSWQQYLTCVIPQVLLLSEVPWNESLQSLLTHGDSAGRDKCRWMQQIHKSTLLKCHICLWYDLKT